MTSIRTLSAARLTATAVLEWPSSVPVGFELRRRAVTQHADGGPLAADLEVDPGEVVPIVTERLDAVPQLEYTADAGAPGSVRLCRVLSKKQKPVFAPVPTSTPLSSRSSSYSSRPTTCQWLWPSPDQPIATAVA